MSWALVVLTIISSVNLAQASAKQSVFKLYVKTKSASSVYIEGTAFVIGTDGPADNPHVYFLTSAHNFFLSNEFKSDPTSVDNILEAKVQYATGGYWPIDPQEIRIPDKWYSYSKDVAFFRIKSVGRTVPVLPLKFAMPSAPRGKSFRLIGYPSVEQAEGESPSPTFDEPSEMVLAGAADEKGSNCRGQNFELAGQYDHGMSGGPVLFDGSVVALISDKGPSESFRCIQTLRIVEDWIKGNLPTYDGSAAVWRDTATGLMWTGRDSGDYVNWIEAKAYCSKKIADLSGWRLPTIQELKGIYDPSHRHDYVWRDPHCCNVKGDDPGLIYVKSGIKLDSCCAWSSERSSDESRAFYYRFQPNPPDDQRVNMVDVGSVALMRALCVRSVGGSRPAQKSEKEQCMEGSYNACASLAKRIRSGCDRDAACISRALCWEDTSRAFIIAQQRCLDDVGPAQKQRCDDFKVKIANGIPKDCDAE